VFEGDHIIDSTNTSYVWCAINFTRSDLADRPVWPWGF